MSSHEFIEKSPPVIFAAANHKINQEQRIDYMH